MSHLVLHIGTHKTGTTALQNLLRRESDRLAKAGVIYPRLNYRHSGHHGLIAESVQLPTTYHLAGGGVSALRGLARRYARQDISLILSSEEFSRADSAKRVCFSDLAAIFSAFDKITVVCALRPQWRFLQAIYLEISRNRSPPRPPALVAEALETGTCQGLHMDYLALHDRLTKAFGCGAVRYLDFEKLRGAPTNLVTQVLHIAGCAPTLSAELKVQRANVSAPPLPQWAAALLSEPYPTPPDLPNVIQQALQRHRPDRPTCLLTRTEVADLTATFAASNAALLERQKPYQPSVTLTDPPVPDTTIFREDVGIEFWLECGRALLRPRLTEIAK